MGENLGPAGAIAYAIQWLIEAEYNWIFCGDDDDPPRYVDEIERLLNVIQSTASRDAAGVGAFGSLWDWETGKLKRLPDEALTDVTEVDIIGGNGHPILNSAVIKEVGLPNRHFFFGLDDWEYCLRLRNAGYRLLVDGHLMRDYRARAGRLNFKRRRSLLPRHSYQTIWRQYYSTRNYIFAMNQTFQHPNLARRETLRALGRAFFSWGRGPKYGLAFTNLQIRGVLDGYLGRMGRTVLPQPKYKGNKL
jgi:GT2 family glycosyltransferase